MDRVAYSLAILAIHLAARATAQVPLPPESPTYDLDIVLFGNIQTCGPAQFSFSITPALSAQALLSVSIHSQDNSFNKLLTQDLQLGEGSWLWNPVVVPTPGQYTLSMSSVDPDQYIINGLSAPFIIQTIDTSCFHASTSISPGTSAPPSTPPPVQTSSPPPPNTSTTTPSHSTASSDTSSSSSPSNTTLPGNLSASHTSTGLKAGVSVAVVAVVLAGAAALYWLLVNRRHSRRAQNHFGYDPGYDNLGSRDDQVAFAVRKPPSDPLGRTLSGGSAAGAAVNSYSHSGLLDEKGATPFGGASSNGATAGHSGTDSFVAVEHPSQWAAYPVTVPPSAMVARSTSGTSFTTGEGSSSTEHESFQSYGAVQTPRRATRKPVPAYGDIQIPRISQERRKRDSGTSVNSPGTTSSINDLPPQPTRPAPNNTSTQALNHKGSFGESKPMNHVLMPDMPLSQDF